MLEVTVHDVVVSLPAEAATLTQPQACKEHEGLAAVVLKEREGSRLLPVWVGRPEARDIMRYLGAMTAPRPMTFDFLIRVIEAGEMQVDKIAVTRLQGTTFYATVWVRVGQEVREVDARPSDALNLALRVQAPLFVTPEVMAQAGIVPAEHRSALESWWQHIRQREPAGQETGVRVYHSFCALPPAA